MLTKAKHYHVLDVFEFLFLWMYVEDDTPTFPLEPSLQGKVSNIRKSNFTIHSSWLYTYISYVIK